MHPRHCIDTPLTFECCCTDCTAGSCFNGSDKGERPCHRPSGGGLARQNPVRGLLVLYRMVFRTNALLSRPLSPCQKFIRAPQRGLSYRRKRGQIPSSPLVLQTLGPSPRASFTKRRSSRDYSENALTQGEERQNSAEAPPALGLGVGSADAPLLYCKHQEPVPPKDKTPRKLWNAIGGEDRRLIVLQRNHLPPC